MVMIDQTQCIRCGACVRSCPMGVLTPCGPEGQPPAPHPKRRCIHCLHCAAACPKKAVHFEELTDEQVYCAFPEDSLPALIMRRKSIRHFTTEAPPRELLQQALDTASYAPSGKNRRDWRCTIVYGANAVGSLRDRCLDLCREFGEAPELPKLMEHGTDLLTCGAPCMIVMWSPDDALNPVLDPAVVLAQLELLLVSRGLGTCWGGYLHQVSDRFPEIRRLLQIPEGCRLRCALMVGYPKQERYPNAIVHKAPEPVWLTEDTPDL